MKLQVDGSIVATGDRHDKASHWNLERVNDEFIRWENVAYRDHYLSIEASGNATNLVAHNTEILQNTSLTSNSSTVNGSWEESVSIENDEGVRQENVSYHYNWSQSDGKRRGYYKLSINLEEKNCYLSFNEDGNSNEDLCSNEEQDMIALRVSRY